MKITKTALHTGKTALLAALLLATAACAPTMAVRGNMLKDYQVAAVTVGTDTQSDVLRKLGSPTTKAPFDDKVWYYMGQETEKHGILDPQIDKEEIYEVTFNDQGVVTSIQNATHKREDFAYVRDKTPTTGNEITVMQQLVGNLGRFNKDPAAAANSSTNQGNGNNSNKY